VFKPTLDGLSVIGGNAHTDREYAEVESLVPRLYLLTRMVMELGQGIQSRSLLVIAQASLRKVM
jgi:hypothetical protein